LFFRTTTEKIFEKVQHTHTPCDEATTSLDAFRIVVHYNIADVVPDEHLMKHGARGVWYMVEPVRYCYDTKRIKRVAHPG
ncbi:MAG: hypothetical protein ACK45X_04805, partial [Roseiflexaceae bacterium]